MSNRIIEKLLNGAEVEWKPLDKVIDIVISPTKVKKEIYRDKGKTPIIDQGEKFIAGYTDENYIPVQKDEYIIFGDHSEHIKYVDFSFIQGADGLKILKPKEDIAKYIYYAFINFYKKESSYKRHWSVAKETLIPIPPLPVQEKIVKTLDKFTELEATLEATLEAELALRKKQYQYYREILLTFPQDLDRGGYNEITKALYHNTPVVFKALGEVCDVRDGTHDSPAKQQSGKYLITSKNVKNGTVIFDDAYFISEFDFNNINKRSKVDVNDLLFTMIGTVGEIAHITEEPDYAIKNVGLIKTGDEMLARYLFHYLQSQRAKNYIENNRSKGSQAFLALGKLRAFPIPFPSLEEQQKIVNILDKFDRLTNSISEGLPKEIELRRKQYEYYREQLLDFPRTNLS